VKRVARTTRDLQPSGRLAVCIACPARAERLELSLQHWHVGQHGIWGGRVGA
jgi:hypothetical protein